MRDDGAGHTVPSMRLGREFAFGSGGLSRDLRQNGAYYVLSDSARTVEVTPVATNTVSFKCKCGSDQFKIPSTRRPSDVITCAKCGASGRYGDVLRSAQAQVTSAVEKKLKDVFRKSGFKVT